jgi:outer membrane protein assembly factor BamB
MFGLLSTLGADWRQFRGPNGLGISEEKGLPVTWSVDSNVAWKTKLPGPGGSSPVIVGDRIFLTSYTGYGENGSDSGNMADLKRQLICVDRNKGDILWTKEFEPVLPEHKYHGEGAYHGYSSSTPTTDGERLYVFFGKTGLFCFDLDGKQLWHVTVGKGMHGWGSGASPLLYKDLLIVNASVESGTIFALDRKTGQEMWKAPGIRSAWNTPVLVKAPTGEQELVVSVQDRLVGLNPDTGKELWHAEGVHRYVCPSVVAHDGVIYAIGGGNTSLAVKAGGRGDVTMTHVIWRKNQGSNVPSPIYHEGHLYWAADHGGIVYCQDAATGQIVGKQRLNPPPGIIYGSPLLADGKLYFVSQKNGSYVVSATPELNQLAHNIFKDDDRRANASPAVSRGQLLLRNDGFLYCIGAR